MNKIYKEIAVARRRLMIQCGLQILPWGMLVSFAICFVAMLIPKVTYLPYSFRSWSSIWLIAAGATSLIVSVVIAYLFRPSPNLAAVEIDKRFGLQERISSLSMLSKADLEHEAAIELQKDAERKLDRIDVRDQFPLQPSPMLPWILLPLIACVGLFWVPDATSSQAVALSEEAKLRLQNVKEQTKPILSQVKALRETVEEHGLKETSEGLKKLEKRIEEMQGKKDLQPKEMLTDFNAIKKQIEEQKDALKSPEELKNALSELETLEKSVGEKFSEAMKQGDLSASSAELQNIQQMLADGKLSAKDKEQLAQQLAQMDKAIQERLQEQRDKLESMKQQLAKAESSGDIEQAATLRRQVEQAGNALQRAEKSSQMAKDLSKAAKALQNGDSQQASQSLGQLKEALDDMAASESASQELEQMLEDIENAKQSANCKSCTGQGCSECKGGGKSGSGSSSGSKGSGAGQKPSKSASAKSGALKDGKQASGSKSRGSDASQVRIGSGQGAGIGTGSSLASPGDEISTSQYDSRVDGLNNNTERQFGGKVRGTNRPGMTLEEARTIIDSATPEDPEAAESIPLPRAEREQQREYFERLRNQ